MQVVASRGPFLNFHDPNLVYFGQTLVLFDFFEKSRLRSAQKVHNVFTWWIRNVTIKKYIEPHFANWRWAIKLPVGYVTHITLMHCGKHNCRELDTRIFCLCWLCCALRIMLATQKLYWVSYLRISKYVQYKTGSIFYWHFVKSWP